MNSNNHPTGLSFDEFSKLSREEQIDLAFPVFEARIRKHELALTMCTSVFKLLSYNDNEVVEFLAFAKGALRATFDLHGTKPTPDNVTKLFEDAGHDIATIRAKHHAGGEH